MKSLDLANVDGLIWDMDGVLVDISQSYREAIRLTASYFLQRNVTVQEVDTVKNMVGMNNDWDATYKLIDNNTIAYDDVKNYFQQLYLGTKTYPGLIDKESLLLTKEQLGQIKRCFKKMGIATGRPRAELDYVLKKNTLADVFDVTVAMEDTPNQKPDPDPLLRAKQLLQINNPVYIGDSPSDVVAAEKAGMACLFIGEKQLGTIQFPTSLAVAEFLLCQDKQT